MCVCVDDVEPVVVDRCIKRKLVCSVLLFG